MAGKEGCGRHARAGKITDAPIPVNIIRIQDSAGHEKLTVRCVNLLAGDGIRERDGIPARPGAYSAGLYVPGGS